MTAHHSSPPTILCARHVKEAALATGFAACGIAPAAPLSAGRAEERAEMLQRGHHAGMEWLERHEDLRRDPERMIDVRWSGKIGHEMAAKLRIIGRDDIGIVTNITSIINKEKATSLRNISIESHDGLFNGFVVVGVLNDEALSKLVNKLKTVKGVKDVQRI